MNGDRRLVLELLGEGATQAELPRSGVLTIGSAIDKVGLHVQGQGVADVHCAIGRAKGGGFALKDLGSEYGTWVNGERVQQAKLDVGDVILVGSRRLRVVDPLAPATPAAAPKPESAAKTGGSSAPIAPEPATKELPARNEPARSTNPAASAPGSAATSAPMAPAPMTSATPPTTTTTPTTPKPVIAATNYESSPLPRIPGYRIEKLLGRGGMGEVFLATQERLDRKVALKLLSAKLCADADFVRRFQDEARAAAALSHPNVVVVHDVGVEAGRHFLSMEFMDRGTLEARVARGARMGWQDVLGVLHDIASALVYAESRGIVHRDIKPANLMQGAAGATKLADLGLATQIEAEASESENGRIFGTPHFISPEQARGERVDGRSDLYSLGASAYRLLSGRTPFEGATTRDILRGHFTEKPPPLAQLAPEVPAEIVRIVERLLEKRPEDRYPSAGALLLEVDRVRASLIHGESAAPARGSGGKLALVAVGLAIVGVVLWRAFAPAGDGRPVAPPIAQGPTPPGPIDPTPAEPPPETAPKPPRNGDDETRMRLFEAEARLAWKELPADLPPEERANRLEALSRDYAGTSAATDMQAEAVTLRTELAREKAATAEIRARREAALGQLENAAAPHADDAARALSALGAVTISEELAHDAEFQAARVAVYERALARALESASAESRAIDASAARGDFDDVEHRIDGLLPKLSLPALPADIAPGSLPTVAVLESLARELGARREGLTVERASHAVRIVDADRERIATALGINRDFERELRALDFARLAARLGALESALTTQAAKNSVRELATDFASGEAALRMLASEFASGGWKRKQVVDPRSTRASTANATAVDAAGLTLEVDGRAELVPWSAFGGRPDKLTFLFTERLSRPYTSEEARGIEALVRCAAVLAAVDAASEMFERSATARFDEGEQRELVGLFDGGRAWATTAGTLARYEREARAAAVLAQSLSDASRGAWSVSVAGLERLLTEFGDTLLVRMLSSGKPPPVR